MRRNIILCIGTIMSIIVGIQLIQGIINSRRYDFPLDHLIENKASYDNKLIIKDGDSSRRFSLREGQYELQIEYESDSDYTVFLSLDNDDGGTVYLPADGESASFGFVLDFPTDRAYMTFEGGGTVRVKAARIISERAIFTDDFFKLGILVFLYLLFIYYTYKYSWHNVNGIYVLLAIICLIIGVNIPFYLDIGIDYIQGRNAINIMNPATRFGIDTRAHLLRLEGVLFGLKDGQLPVIISPNYLKENGELSFLYPDLFLYPFAILRFFGASISFSYRLMGVCVNIFTCLSMFYSCRQISDNDFWNVLITCLYLFEPHRLMSVLDQGAIAGMALPYIFMPLCIAGIYQILKGNDLGGLCSAVGIFGIMQSHILSLILILLLFLFMLVAFIKDVIREDVRYVILKTVAISIAMNMGFIVIFMYYWYKGVNTSDLLWSYEDYVMSPFELIKNCQSRFLIIMLIAALVLLYLNRKKNTVQDHRLAGALIAYSGILLLLSSQMIPWKFLFSHFHFVRMFFSYLQDPNRFYTITAGSLIMSVLILCRNIKLNKGTIRVSCILALLIVMPGIIAEYSEYLSAQPLLFDEVLGDMNSKDQHDYLPKGVSRGIQFNGVASLSDWDGVESYYYKKKGTHIVYTYSTDQDNVYAEFPLLMYAGYVGSDENGRNIELFMGDQGRVCTYLCGDGEKHTIYVQYRVEMIFTILWIISLLFAVFILFRMIRKLREKRLIIYDNE